MRNLKSNGIRLIFFSSLLFILGCGGGGGDSSGNDYYEAVPYTGVTSAAIISTQNAKQIALNLFGVTEDESAKSVSETEIEKKLPDLSSIIHKVQSVYKQITSCVLLISVRM